MNTQTRKNPVLMVAALLSIMVLTSLACSLGGMTISKRNISTVENQKENICC